jgi:hypothetical protein
MRDTSSYKTVRQKLEVALRALLPDFTQEHMEMRSGPVRVSVSCPREYMGRFDSGKMYWTIDVKETELYSRMKQVRVSVVDDKPSFDQQKVVDAVAEMRRRIAEEQAKKQGAVDRVKLLGEIPSCTGVESHAEDRYTISYCETVDLKKAKKVLAALRRFDL